MAFPKIQIDQSVLTPATKARFIEIEMYYGLRALKKFFPASITLTEAKQLLIKLLAPNDHILQDKFDMCFSSYKFNHPTKEEAIQYFRYKGLGVHAVVKYAAVAPNTVQNYKEKLPIFQPFLTELIEQPELIEIWSSIRSSLNLFNEELIHTKIK